MPRDNAVDAYWNFFSSFNTRDPHEFSMALHYPHIRLSWRREASIVADAEAHAMNMSWDSFIEMGWDHTEGAEPQIIHSSQDKYHIKGGWTRVTKTGSPILTNYVTYIVTRIDGSWGIQCRYGTDPGPDAQSTEENADAVSVVDDWCAAIEAQDAKRASLLCSAPIYIIGIGSVDRILDTNNIQFNHLKAGKSQLVQSGVHSATVAVNGNESNALLYLTDEHGWAIRAISWI